MVSRSAMIVYFIVTGVMLIWGGFVFEVFEVWVAGVAAIIAGFALSIGK